MNSGENSPGRLTEEHAWRRPGTGLLPDSPLSPPDQKEATGIHGAGGTPWATGGPKARAR